MGTDSAIGVQERATNIKTIAEESVQLTGSTCQEIVLVHNETWTSLVGGPSKQWGASIGSTPPVMNWFKVRCRGRDEDVGVSLVDTIPTWRRLLLICTSLTCLCTKPPFAPTDLGVTSRWNLSALSSPIYIITIANASRSPSASYGSSSERPRVRTYALYAL